MDTMKEEQELIYRIALLLADQVGSVLGKRLLERFGSATDVFEAPVSELKLVPGLRSEVMQSLRSKELMSRALKELEFVKGSGICIHFYTDSTYPSRLRNCADPPLLLFSLGNIHLEARAVVGIVGTRKATEYGKQLVKELLAGLPEEVLVVSGLALGIDGAAHQECVETGMKTIGVLGHGLDMIYPSRHRKLAASMLNYGALVTEFPSGIIPDRFNFPRRNRIIAGMSDAIVVIESGLKGGSIITADIANGYNRDVFAYPGRKDDAMSQGCNNLIRTNRAMLIQEPDDLLQVMGWKNDQQKKPHTQKRIFVELDPDEQQLCALLSREGTLAMEEITVRMDKPASKVAVMLTMLEMKGVISVLPGKMISLV